jgi:hypothetical protein
MPKVTESALVAAPAERVFQMFVEPQRAVMFVPGLSRINNISPDKRSWDFEFNWLGLVISGHSECTASEAPKRYQFQTLTATSALGPTAASSTDRTQNSRWKWNAKCRSNNWRVLRARRCCK